MTPQARVEQLERLDAAIHICWLWAQGEDSEVVDRAAFLRQADELLEERYAVQEGIAEGARR